MRRKSLIRIMAFALALIMPFGTFVLANAATESEADTTVSSGSKYDSLSINELTGHGGDPEELSVSAGAKYQEKAWYEYVVYSDKAVCSYKVDDNARILFYDPYTYTNAMVMDVKYDAKTTDFDTMSEYSISITNTKSIDTCVASTDTTTVANQTSGRDYTETNVENGGKTTTIYNHSIDNPTYGTVTEVVDRDYKEYRYKTSSETTEGGGGSKNLGNTLAQTISGALSGFATGGPLGALVSGGLGMMGGLEVSAKHSTTHTDNAGMYLDQETKTTKYSDDYKTSTEYTGEDTIEYDTTSKTTGWTELSARVTKTLGSSISTSTSWSESESTTVTKPTRATHFAADGVTPLPWAIVHYTVQMPMKCCLQVKYSGEWITVSTVYTLLTTVKGTCRAWMQNGQVYYEDWGSGEPVVATDFWAQFMTKEQLVASYQDKLYPVNESK